VWDQATLPKTGLSPIKIVCSLGVNRDGYTLGVIPFVCKNGLYNMKMDNLVYSLLAAPTIPTIKIVDLLTP
jgi:hypothetical protein